MDFDIYCDECFPDLFCSEKPQARYALIGSLWLPTEKRAEFKTAIHALRDRYQVGGEIKSRKVSPSRLEFYKALCDWFFDQGDDLRSRGITIEASKLNLKSATDAYFVTCYVADDPETKKKILNSPGWKNPFI